MAFNLEVLHQYLTLEMEHIVLFFYSYREDHNSFHRVAEKSCDDLMKQSQHITKVYDKFDSEDIANNWLWLKASIDVVKVLAFQDVAFRDQDESSSSKNHELNSQPSGLFCFYLK